MPFDEHVADANKVFDPDNSIQSLVDNCFGDETMEIKTSMNSQREIKAYPLGWFLDVLKNDAKPILWKQRQRVLKSIARTCNITEVPAGLVRRKILDCYQVMLILLLHLVLNLIRINE